MAKTGQTSINDLIFNELIKRGYSLDGNTRVWNIADSKLWYLTPEQAEDYLNLESSADYQKTVIQKEIDLINDNIDELLEDIESASWNIIDLGCGDGKKAAIFINHLKNKVKLRYCPIDISSYMVKKSIERISKLNIGEVVKFQWNISDFENLDNISALLRAGEFKKNFILLLGNTLGNFEINDLLYKIRISMREGDFVLIGNGLNNRNQSEVIKSYFNKEVDNFLVHIPLQLGLKREDITLGVSFNNSRVDLYYTLNKDKMISFQNKKLIFKKGDRIIVAYSYKYDRHEFMSFLKMYFDNIKLFTSKDNSYALALCKK